MIHDDIANGLSEFSTMTRRSFVAASASVATIAAAPPSFMRLASAPLAHLLLLVGDDVPADLAVALQGIDGVGSVRTLHRSSCFTEHEGDAISSLRAALEESHRNGIVIAARPEQRLSLLRLTAGGALPIMVEGPFPELLSWSDSAFQAASAPVQLAIPGRGGVESALLAASAQARVGTPRSADVYVFGASTNETLAMDEGTVGLVDFAIRALGADRPSSVRATIARLPATGQAWGVARAQVRVVFERPDRRTLTIAISRPLRPSHTSSPDAPISLGLPPAASGRGNGIRVDGTKGTFTTEGFALIGDTPSNVPTTRAALYENFVNVVRGLEGATLESPIKDAYRAVRVMALAELTLRSGGLLTLNEAGEPFAPRPSIDSLIPS